MPRNKFFCSEIMRALIQRVSEVQLVINKITHTSIGLGLLVLIGFEEIDGDTDLDWMAKKILQLRIFTDEQGAMNLCIGEIHGEILVVSQFTLFASTKKGNRPSFIRAAKPESAHHLYDRFIDIIGNQAKVPIKQGVFGANMQIFLCNDGPVTVFIDSKNRE